MVTEEQELDRELEQETEQESLNRRFSYIKFLASVILLLSGISLFFVFDLGTFTVFDMPTEASLTALGISLTLMVLFLIALLAIFYKNIKKINEVKNNGIEKEP